MTTQRQKAWTSAAIEAEGFGNVPLAGLFSILAVPNREETDARRTQRQRQAVKDSCRGMNDGSDR